MVKMIKRLAVSLAASALAATAIVGVAGSANAAPSDDAVQAGHSWTSSHWNGGASLNGHSWT